MHFEGFSFGLIQIDGVSYQHDVVIDRGKVRKDPVVVVALAFMELFFIAINALANRGRHAEIKSGALDRSQLTCGAEGGIHRRKARGIYLELMLQDGAFALTSKI